MYWHILVFGSIWPNWSKILPYNSQCSCSGWTLPSWIFAKLILKMASLLSKHKMEILMYLEDWLVSALSLQEVQNIRLDYLHGRRWGLFQLPPNPPWFCLIRWSGWAWSRILRWVLSSCHKSTVSGSYGNCFMPKYQPPSLADCGRAFVAFSYAAEVIPLSYLCHRPQRKLPLPSRKQELICPFPRVFGSQFAGSSTSMQCSYWFHMPST